MRNYIFLIGFFIAVGLYSQTNINGTIIDIGNNLEVTGVDVFSLPSQAHVTSDKNGSFSMLLNTPENLSNKDVYILNNKLYWNDAAFYSIALYDLKSSLVFSSNIENRNAINLPRLSAGYYILSLKNSFKHNNFLVFSDGEKTTQIRKSDLNSMSLAVDTALLFQKDAYFSLIEKIDNQWNDKKIYILKKQYDSLTYFTQLVSYQAFKMLSNTPSVTNFGNVREIKIIHDLNTDSLYYINIKVHRSHFTFAKNHLGYELDANEFLRSQYSNGPNRYLNLATILYHESINKYILQFSSLDQISCEGIEQTYEKVLSTSFFENNLFFYSNKQEWNQCLDIPKITSEELYLGQSYQALNIQENYGYLIKADVNQLDQMYLGRHHIVILNGIPNDISVVGGIITTEFQTALSHINILSHNRNTPNMAFKEAWSNPQFNTLLNKLVYLKVENDTFYLRSADITEAEEFWASHEPSDTIDLALDTLSSGIIELENENIASVNKIGGKAANFSELVNLDTIPIPEDYFAIPFYYYHQHIKQHHLDVFINEMLSEAKFHSDQFYRKMKLIQLQNLIKEAPVDPNLIELIENRIDHFNRFSSYRFRSSTNAEDLEDFSGAGLYASYSANKNDPDKTIAKAIKKVWASLWDIRAFEERSYYKINHQTVAMGILVHRSFPNEDANGVVITSNLYNVNHAYTVNCQYKDISIVYPEPGILHDQILIHTKSYNEDPYNIEYLSHSNVPELNGETVLSDEKLFELGDYCTIIKNYYYNHIASDVSNGYESFSVDIEFKIDSSVSPRKLYIKQARIYKAN